MPCRLIEQALQGMHEVSSNEKVYQIKVALNSTEQMALLNFIL